MNTTEVKKRVKAELTRCMAVAKAKYPDHGLAGLNRIPTVKFAKKGTTAGTAHDRTYTIDLNMIIMIDNPDSIEDTVAHEYAHLVDGVVNPETRESGYTYNRRGRMVRQKRDIHGYSWKSIMILFGKPPERCHSLDVSRARVRNKRSTKVHVWKCGCGNGQVVLTNASHKKQLVATGKYGYYQRGHTVARCGKYSYFGIEGQELTPMPIAANDIKATSIPKTVVDAPRPIGGVPSKLDKCRKVYDPELSRAANIVAFTEEGCTPAGAATYFAKIKKEF